MVVTMTDAQLPRDVLDATNYFVCTLGQAAVLNAEKPQSFKTINDFIDLQAQQRPLDPAVGFPIPPKDKEKEKEKEKEWDYAIYSE